MKIELSQSGGFAGETIKLKEISTDKIPAAIKEKITALLEETDFFNISHAKRTNEAGADFLTYHLKISNSKNQSNTVSFDDNNNDPAFSKLLTLIKTL